MRSRSSLSVGPCGAAAAIVVMASLPAQAIVIGTLDNFQDLTTQGWEGAAPVNQPSGGPAGVGDAFLQITSTGGNGPGSRLATDNSAPRWTGDYLSAGVTAIEADFLNLGTTTLEMRIVVFHGSINRFTSTVADVVPADGAWHHMVFALDAGSLTRVLGTDTYEQALSSVDNLMLRHNSGSPSAGGTPIASSLGIDNIQAVPAPGPAGLLAVAVGALSRRRRR